jgi:hypothetical protein
MGEIVSKNALCFYEGVTCFDLCCSRRDPSMYNKCEREVSDKMELDRDDPTVCNLNARKPPTRTLLFFLTKLEYKRKHLFL